MARASRAVNGGQALDTPGRIVNWVDLVRRLNEAMDPFATVRVSEYQPIFSSLPLPISVINDRDFTSGNATIEYTNGELELDRAGGEDCALLTAQRGRYQSGLIGVPGIGFRRDTNPIGTTAYYWGYFDKQASAAAPLNGFGFKEDATTVSTVVVRNGSEVYSKARSEWLDRLDGTGGKQNPSGLNVDVTDGLVCRYPFGYYGYMTIEFGFIVEDAPDHTDEFIAVDRVNFPGEISLPYANLPISVFIIGDSPGRCYIGGRQYGVYGQLNLRRRITGEYRVAQSVSAANGFVPAISARVRRVNPYDTIPIQVAGISFKTDGAFDWAIVIGATLNNDGDANWNISRLSQGDTSTEYNIASTTQTGGEIIGGPGIVTGSGGSNVTAANFDIPDQDIPVGEPVTVVVQSHSGTINVRSALRMAELR